MFIDIDKIANISKISLTNEERIRIKKKIEDIMEYVKIINQYCIDNNLNDMQLNKSNQINIMREDVQIQSSDQEKEIILKNAPNKIENLFSVPLLVKRID